MLDQIETSQSQMQTAGNPLIWGLIIGIGYGLILGYLSSFHWLIGVPAVFMAVTAVGEMIKLFKKMGKNMPTYWLATLFGALVADFSIIMLPLTLVTFQGELDGTITEKLNVVWKFYLLSLKSFGSSRILTITAGLGLLGFVGIYRR